MYIDMRPVTVHTHKTTHPIFDTLQILFNQNGMIRNYKKGKHEIYTAMKVQDT